MRRRSHFVLLTIVLLGAIGLVLGAGSDVAAVSRGAKLNCLLDCIDEYFDLADGCADYACRGDGPCDEGRLDACVWRINQILDECVERCVQ
jgi:hypothetical protein